MTATSEQIRLRAALISLTCSAIVLGLKTLAYFQTKSAAILSDALESIVNVVAAVVALGVVYYVSQPADREHPYGHGKLEYFSSAFEGGMIFFASLMILHESIKAFFGESNLQSLSEGIYIIIFANLINLILGLYLKKVGKQENSEALQASGSHVLSDCWTTVGVILGLLLVKLTGYAWLDPLVAMLVALHLAFEGSKIVRRSINGLIDGMDADTLSHLTAAINSNRTDGVIDIHNVRSIRSGKFHHIDAHIVVPEFWDVKKVHEMTHHFENKVVTSYKFDGEFAFHVDPCQRKYCSSCQLRECEIRQKDFFESRPFTVEHLIDGPKYTV